MRLEPDADSAVKPLDIKDKDSLSIFVRDIHKFPVLEAEEEYQLATKWLKDKDVKAMKKLIESHLRLVLKIAQGYRGYGLPLSDLIAEGNIGMMQALRKFNPAKGFRFSTYAAWWIRSAIQEYVLKNWSLVRIGTTAAQKKLFFNLKNLRAQLEENESHLTAENALKISKELDVPEEDVLEMSQRLQSQDYSLNAPLTEVGEGEWQDWLVSPEENQETSYLHRKEMEHRQSLLQKAMHSLTAREYDIIKYRRLHEPPKTLEELALKFNLSKERIRQIEIQAFHKLQAEIRQHTQKQYH
jgi:RNA polymerase sigma-32 factor